MSSGRSREGSTSATRSNSEHCDLCTVIAYAVSTLRRRVASTLRTLSPQARTRGLAAFERICSHVAAEHGCTAEVAIDPGYPPTVNDERAVALVRELAGEAFVEPGASNMGGEDFSYVLEKVPGAMAFLGVAAPGSDPASRAPLHNPRMMIDETALTMGVALHCGFATRFLSEGWQ